MSFLRGALLEAQVIHRRANLQNRETICEFCATLSHDDTLRYIPRFIILFDRI